MKVIEPDKKTNWKSGKVNSDSQLKYELYIETLRKKYLQSDDMENTTTSEHIGNGYRIAGELNDTLCSKEMSAVDDKNKGNITNYSLKKIVFFSYSDWAQQFFFNCYNDEYLFILRRTYRRSQTSQIIEE